MKPENYIHIVGRKNHGKTCLIETLINEFTKRGLTVGSIKQSSHNHEVDIVGKDSFRHRQAGANPSAFITPQAVSIFIPRQAGDDPYAMLAPLYGSCQIVIVEGHIEGKGYKIEVWRADLGKPPLAMERSDIVAVVTDDPTPTQKLPILSRSDISQVVEFLIHQMET